MYECSCTLNAEIDILILLNNCYYITSVDLQVNKSTQNEKYYFASMVMSKNIYLKPV